MHRLLLAAQLAGTLAVLAWLPGNLPKLAAMIVIGWAGFRPLARRELALAAAVCALMSAMNVGALRQGVFSFAHPDLLGMPVWEFLMWGFYVLHVIRMVGGPAPRDRPWVAFGLAIAFAIPFATVSDQGLLLATTAGMLAVAVVVFHEKLDLAYIGYTIVVGALIEYTGVWSGQWSYPGTPPGGVPLWFVPMWGGVGLFTRRLALPIARRP